MEQEQSQEFVFERFFTLEEAAGMIPDMKQSIEKAQHELAEVRDQIVLYKRFQHQREQTGGSLTEDEETVLQQKWELYEAIFSKWVQKFLDLGIVARDIDRGLIDFPYRSRSGEVFFLCWQWDEDGLFYFHDLQSGFKGRQPITLLPE